MHEVSIVQNTLQASEAAARNAGASRIHLLRLRVGQLSGVVPEALSMAFEVVRAGTLAAEARLEVEWIPVACWCAACQAEFPSEDFACECPRCHGFSADVRRGRELELTSIEVS